MSVRIPLPEAAPPLTPGTAGTARFVQDPAGHTWRVSEREPPAHLADRCERCLIFDAGTVVRRICGQGADWHRLTDLELLALCALPS